MSIRRTEMLLVFLLVFLGIFFLLLALMKKAGMHLVLTPSVPIGVYQETHEPLEKGRYVVVCLPEGIATFAQDRGYIKEGTCQGIQPSIKKIYAMAGDVIDIELAAVSVNGVTLSNSQTQEVDSKGRTLPHVIFGKYTVQEGEIWVLSLYAKNSFDSRYYGPLYERQLISTARPILVFGEGD